MIIRKAILSDLPAVAAIYDRIHTEEELGRCRTGWIREIYPTRETAETALAAGDLFVLEDEGNIVASARINQEQMPAYTMADWQFPARHSQVLVLHTLTVDPQAQSKGYGRQFVRYYETAARAMHCRVLRMDTNQINNKARAFYAGLGFREAGIIPCVFNGIPDVKLVCLEKEV